jgi:hypothetical protein
MMKRYEINAARKAGISLTPALDTNWCQVATEIADYLEHLAQEIPPWKFWIRPGLRLAASLVRTIRDLRCR